MACCPFHEEHTASFKIFDEGQKWKCFGCGKSGDLIDLVAEVSGISNDEAIKFLAKDLDIKQEERAPSKKIRDHYYQDETGLKIIRKDMYSDNNGKKSAYYYRLENGKYIKGLDGLNRPLYKLPELLKAIAEGQVVYFVEGGERYRNLIEYRLICNNYGRLARPFTARTLTQAVSVDVRSQVDGMNDEDKDKRIQELLAKREWQKGKYIVKVVVDGYYREYDYNSLDDAKARAKRLCYILNIDI